MKDYINLEALTRFLSNLFGKFSIIGHKHIMSDIEDFELDSSQFSDLELITVEDIDTICGSTIQTVELPNAEEASF